MFQQVIAGSFAATPDPVGSQRRRRFRGGGSLERQLGKRILPRNFNIYDDPRPLQHGSKFLLGHYLIDDEGVEAQRVLRLEKGHIIIGQDTDAMSTPDEVDMAWAIAKKKAFFIGGRSIELRRRHPSKRKLVGFTLEGAESPLPEESNLVLRGGEMVGFVTSVARSPALGKVIGLAYTAADEAEPGSALAIKLTSGRTIEGRVCAPHFYHPDNQRQEM